MKGFNQFIGEGVDDWSEWPIMNILSDKQCQIIEDTLGKNPEFIVDRTSSDFGLIDRLTSTESQQESINGRWSDVTRYTPAPGLDIFWIQGNDGDTEVYFALKQGDLAKLQNGDTTDWYIESLFSDF